jgi:hypothetical protein
LPRCDQLVGRQFGKCGQVLFQFEALHAFVITKVSFTTDSIQGKTRAGYEEVIDPFPGTLFTGCQSTAPMRT